MDNLNNPHESDRSADQGAPQEPQHQDAQLTPRNQALLDSLAEFERKYTEGIEVLTRFRENLATEMEHLRKNGPVSETKNRLNRAWAVVEEKLAERNLQFGRKFDGESGGQEQKTIGDGVQSGRKRALGEDTVPEAKKAKKEVLFVIFGHHSRKYPKNNGPLIKILTDLGFKLKLEHDIMADVPIPTRLLNSKLLLKFSVPSSSTETELLEWLGDDSTVTRIYLENKEKFGSEVTRYHLVASYLDIEEIRMMQFMMHLMQEHEVYNTLENFKSITTKDLEAMKTMLHTTPGQILEKTLKAFSKNGQREIIDAFVKLTQVQRSFWNDLKFST